MDTGWDLSMDFQSQVEGSGYPHDIISFDHHHSQQQLPDPNCTIEMIDRLSETRLDAMPDAGVPMEVPELLEPHLGMEFDLLDSARDFYFNYAKRVGFRVRASRFRTSRRDDSMIMRRFVCYKEGFYANKDKKGDAKERKRRGSLRVGCGAMFEVVRNDRGTWVVAKLVIEHNHPLSGAVEVHKHKRKKEVPSVSSLDMFDGDAGDGGASLRRKFSWGGGEAFSLLEYFKKMQARNPAFFYAIQVDEDRNSIVNVLWADPRARMAYSYFGDTVALDTTFRKNKHMMPFVTFTGTNHHLQPVVFACAVLVDETEASLVWLLESFLTAMCGRHPVSFVMEHTEALDSVVAKVLPCTQHRYGKWQILSKCMEKLPDLCSNTAEKHVFKKELRKCIDDPETVEEFQLSWEAILHKYNLGENAWMQSLYNVRQQWARVYLKDTFFAEMSPTQRSESMKKFFRRNFEKKTSLAEFIQKFDQAMMVQYDKEIQADLANMCTGPVLLTGLQIEKQAAEVYTKTIFSIFQEELVQSSSYTCLVDKCEDGIKWKYHVVPDGQNGREVYTVSFSYAEKGTSCSCSKFEFSGILCRHILRVFAAAGVSNIPEEYILKRWRKTAKSGPILFESIVDAQASHQQKLIMRTNSLFLDVLKYAAECATSLEMYNASKMALQQAYVEVLASKRLRSS